MPLNEATEAARVDLNEIGMYVPHEGDVIWTPTAAAEAWGMGRQRVLKLCHQGRVRHLKLGREVVILDRDPPARMEPGTLSPEQRAAIGRGSKVTSLARRDR